MSLPKTHRVIRSSEFRYIYSHGSRISNRLFAAFSLQLDEKEAPSRFGFTAPRSLGKAVKRNRIKRRMREAVRHEMELLPASWAIVFNPRRSVLDVPFEELCREVGRILSRCAKS